MKTRTLSVRAHLAFAIVVVIAAGCASKKSGDRPSARPASTEDVEITVMLDDGASAVLPAELTLPSGNDPVTVVLIVPGGGNISRRGTRTGDGEVEYASAVETSVELASVFADHGLATLAWDKRSCGPRDDALCEKQPVSDVDRHGPRALAVDVDAACAFARALPRAQDVILWAHGQAAQVALSSTCADAAAAVVLVAPPPRRIDRVLTDGLKHRSSVLASAAKKAKGNEKKELGARAHAMKERAAQLDETFKAVLGGKFPKDARLMGFPITYWQGWLALTDEIPGDAPKPRVPWLVIIGEGDVQFSPADRERIQKLGALKGAQGFVLPGVDHHLLKRDAERRAAVDESALMPILEALHALTTGARDDPGEV
jgi:pimeloyl-ACP methyl ester carboxylesterase